MNKLFESGELMSYGNACSLTVQSVQDEKDYAGLILLKAGDVAQEAAFYNERVVLPAVIYIPPGVADRFMPDREANGYFIRFKKEFLPANKIDGSAAFFNACSIPLSSSPLQGTVTQLFKMILGEYSSEGADMRTLQYLLLSLLAKIDFARRRAADKVHCKERDCQVCQAFLTLLEENFSSNHKVEFYSKQLNVSLRSLNYITTRVLGKSVLQLIDIRRHAEAQALLANSSKSITEIAYELGFDKSYFSRFFYKKAGVTPMQFRQGRQKAVS